MSSSPWQIWIDTGGTFTDCIYISPSGQSGRLKVLSSGIISTQVISLKGNQIICNLPEFTSEYNFSGYSIKNGKETYSIDEQQGDELTLNGTPEILPGGNIILTANEEAPILASRIITNTRIDDDLPPIVLKLGTTKATNALLERTGDKPKLYVTKGFKDILNIGDQRRLDLFSLDIKKPDNLVSEVIEVEEEIDQHGNVIQEINPSSISSENAAVSFINSYRNPIHEKDQARRIGGNVSIGSNLSQEIKYLDRTNTAVVNAYVKPIIDSYILRILKKLKQPGFQLMTNAGGLINSNQFNPKDGLISGPAGGVAGAMEIARKYGNRAITFDMGGTSTDVSRITDRLTIAYECRVGNVSIQSPSVEINTVAAGGGSICGFDGKKFYVGPESAGSNPGPACYGMGGPLTITDVNLLLGRLDEEKLGFPVYRQKAVSALNQLLYESGTDIMEAANLLEGFIRIANERMASAIRVISISKGIDPKDYVMVAFGGAGGMHACEVAELLGIRKVVVPQLAGVLSAFGIGRTKRKSIRSISLFRRADDDVNVQDIFSNLLSEAREELLEQGVPDENIETGREYVQVRLLGQDDVFELEREDLSNLKTEFKRRFQSQYGFWSEGKEIELVSAKVEVLESNEENFSISAQSESSFEKAGPTVIATDIQTSFIPEGWTAILNDDDDLILEQSNTTESVHIENTSIQLELFVQRFTSVAEEMGEQLRRSSFSVNIKERLDFSCAVLDKTGQLIVNAPHIPVHLGALGTCVRSVIQQHDLKEGDIIVTNHPGYGGSHLPDVTLIMPVYHNGIHIGFLANRSHHAEIGGKSPGSMPADASKLIEEGVIIEPILIQESGQVDKSEVRTLLESAAYPSRNIVENLADLDGAIASLNKGHSLMMELCLKHGSDNLMRYMKEISDYASDQMEKYLSSIPDFNNEAIENMDDGSSIQVAIRKENTKLKIDFSGTSPSHSGNLNATRAIIQSAVLYSLRCILNKDLPMNEGLLKNVNINLPECFLNPDFEKEKDDLPAVVGGNVETSQRVVDTIFKAFEVAGCSQGTMNNVLFGNDSFGYYETICGGSGATETGHGASAVHCNMTNTRITDPEVMELRYPVRIEEFSIRQDSGGKGVMTGGNGARRVFRFKDDLELTLLSEHRNVAPYGMKGGKEGSTGNQFVTWVDGSETILKGRDNIQLKKGDRFTIETPGGGGFGK